MKLSPNEIAWLAGQHWTGNDQVIAVAVAMAESNKGDTEALGYSVDSAGNVGNVDHGLFQISNKWHQRNADGSPGRLLLAGAKWRDPKVNTEMAKGIWDDAKRAGKDPWTPWHVYTSGSYLKYMDAATIAVKAGWAPDEPDNVRSVLGALDGKG